MGVPELPRATSDGEREHVLVGLASATLGLPQAPPRALGLDTGAEVGEELLIGDARVIEGV